MEYFRTVVALQFTPDTDDADAFARELVESGFAVIGTPDDCCELIHRLEEQTGGFGAFLVMANDWADREHDAKTRPGRPIPSGAIPAGLALALGLGLLVLGPVLALQVDRFDDTLDIVLANSWSRRRPQFSLPLVSEHLGVLEFLVMQLPKQHAK